VRMFPPHRNGHAADAAGQCSATEQATAMQRFDVSPFMNAELPKPLGLAL